MRVALGHYVGTILKGVLSAIVVFIALESGDVVLLETGDKMIREG